LEVANQNVPFPPPRPQYSIHYSPRVMPFVNPTQYE
jgi:hypothetical protein